MKNKWISIISCIFFVSICYASVTANQSNDQSIPNSSGTLRHVLLTVTNAPKVASDFIKQGYDVFEDTISESSFELIVGPRSLQYLLTQGFSITILAEGKPFREIQFEQQGKGLLVPAGYQDYPAIVDALYDWEAQYPNICKVYDLTTVYGVNATYESRHMYALKISDNVAVDEDEPNFLMVGAHHAREIVPPVLCNYSIQKFTTQYGVNTTITNAVNNYEIWISPVWNPDGYVYMYNYDNMWRKNRNPPDGVDLNRNYPFGWNSPGGGSTNPYDETYKGASPASEPETQTMIALGKDRHFAKVLDYHSSGREVLYSYLSLTHPFSSFLQSEAVRLSTAVGYGGSTRLASADGENYQWHLAYNGSYSNLIETHTSFQPTYASALTEAAMVWPGTLWELQRPISISGHVTDAFTGAPLVATIVLEGVTFTNGEHYMSEPRFGRYHLFLPPATYNVNFSAPGYTSQTHQVTVSLSSAELLEVHLTRPNEPPNTPTLTGNTNGYIGQQNEYSFSTTDPDNDSVTFYVDWGDGTNTSWLGPFAPGYVATSFHKWETSGTFQVKVKARDIYGEESSWSPVLPVQITPRLTKTLIFGLITEKNDTGDVITFKAKFLIVPPHIYRSEETIMISENYTFGFIRDRFVFGVFDTAVLSTFSPTHPFFDRLRSMVIP